MEIVLLVLSSFAVGVVTEYLSIVNKSKCNQATLQCNITQNFTYVNISWENRQSDTLCYWTNTHNKLQFKDRISCQYTANQLTLTINELRSGDEGFYYCILMADRDHDNANTLLEVNDCPKSSQGIKSNSPPNKAETTTAGPRWLLLLTGLASVLNF